MGGYNAISISEHGWPRGGGGLLKKQQAFPGLTVRTQSADHPEPISAPFLYFGTTFLLLSSVCLLFHMINGAHFANRCVIRETKDNGMWATPPTNEKKGFIAVLPHSNSIISDIYSRSLWCLGRPALKT